MNLPTNERDWLPLAANPREWWRLINKKPHEALPESRRAAMPGLH
jgi:hypothetical protein